MCREKVQKKQRRWGSEEPAGWEEGGRADFLEKVAFEEGPEGGREG